MCEKEKVVLLSNFLNDNITAMIGLPIIKLLFKGGHFKMTRLMKKSKKGFTLVELLVVIAILAILASVSVVGYLGFTKKAKQSNCETELAQIRTLVRGEFLAATNTSATDDIYFTEDKNLVVEASTSDEDAVTKITTKLTDLDEETKKKIAVTGSAVEDNWKITAFTYSYEEGVAATWTLATDVIAAAK